MSLNQDLSSVGLVHHFFLGVNPPASFSAVFDSSVSLDFQCIIKLNRPAFQSGKDFAPANNHACPFVPTLNCDRKYG